MMNRNRFNNLSDGSRARLQRMRNYAQRWNTDESKKARGISPINWREARTFGVGSIRTDEHGPTFDNYDGANIPASVLDGLRDTGTAASIANLRHSGWFADDLQDETYSGHVWQLPARDGEPLYIAGYVERDSGYAMLCASNGRLETFDDPREAAIAADGLAESNAETEREYSERWRAATDLDSDIDQSQSELKAIRADWKKALRAWNESIRLGALECAALAKGTRQRCREEYRKTAETLAKLKSKLSNFADVER